MADVPALPHAPVRPPPRQPRRQARRIGTGRSDDWRSVDTSNTLDEYPVDAASLHTDRARDDHDDELAELEERASRVEHALRMVDEEIFQLEHAASVAESVSPVRSLARSSVGQRSLGPGGGQLMPYQGSGYGSGFGAFGLSYSPQHMQQPQHVTINNFNQPVNQMFNTSNNTSSSRPSRRRRNMERRAQRGRQRRRNQGPTYESQPQQHLQMLKDISDDGEEVDEYGVRRVSTDTDSYSSFGTVSTGSSGSGSGRSRRGRRRGRGHMQMGGGRSFMSRRLRSRSRTSQSSYNPTGNVFRDIGQIAKEKADDEDKDLLMAIKASIGFAAAMIGEALFLRLREWLDGTQPTKRPTPQEKAAADAAAARATTAAGQASASSVHPAVKRARNDMQLRDLVARLRSQGKLHEAEMLLKKSLSIRRSLYGNEHPAVAHSLNQLASLLSEQGKLDEAEPMFKESLDICVKVYPEEHPKEALLLNNLAVLMLLRANEDKDMVEKANELGLRALHIARKTYGNDHPITKAYLCDWGDAKEEARAAAVVKGRQEKEELDKQSAIEAKEKQNNNNNNKAEEQQQEQQQRAQQQQQQRKADDRASGTNSDATKNGRKRNGKTSPTQQPDPKTESKSKLTSKLSMKGSGSTNGGKSKRKSCVIQ